MRSIKKGKKEKEDPDALLEHYPKIICDLLLSRGIKTKEEAENFFDPDYVSGLHDPFLLKDMDRAVERIISAIGSQERIAIYGDYDADGITAATILNDFFKKICFSNFEVYIPHRHDEGFGLNIEAVREIAGRGVDLIITVDNGIVDIEAGAEAKALGIDLIVTDHHEPKNILPEACAVVDPKRKDDEYPFKELCGAGVAFKMVQALLSAGNFGVIQGWEKWLLDLAAIGTIADMVPLAGENRIIAKYGLQVLRKTRRPGILSILRKADLDHRNISEDDIGFSVAPRINAASRTGTPLVAFKCVSASDEEEASNSADYLEKKNNERKKIIEAMWREAKNILEEKGDAKVIVIGRDEWSPALAGLLAGRLKDTYEKPAFVWGRSGGGTVKGSSRSNGSVDLTRVMSAFEGDEMFKFGGHPLAGGFSFFGDDTSHFESRVVEVCEKIAGDEPGELEGERSHDAIACISDADWRVYELLTRMAPFGRGNERPVILFEDVEILGIRKFGKNCDHMELRLTDGDGEISAYDFYKNEKSFDGVLIEEGRKIDLLGTLEKNNYGREPSLRLRIVNIH